MAPVVINSIPMSSRLASGVKDFRSLVESDRRRAQKHCSPHTIGHGPRKHHHAHHQPQPGQSGGGSGSQPAPSTGSCSVNVTNATVTYMMPCTVGGQDFRLLIDTGSSNTWVGAGQKFQPNSSCKSTRKTVNVSYGSGSFNGTEYQGPVVLGAKGSGMPEIPNQSFAVADTATGFQDMDGILGIGPTDLTQNTVNGMDSVPTVTDNLCKQGSIKSELIGISYEPTTGANLANGELIFGDVDTAKCVGEITYVPITSTSPASKYWGIDQTVTYGTSEKPILLKTAGIVDTGTTLVMIATDAFKAYQGATGATMDQTTGLLKLTEEQFNNMQSLFFEIGGIKFELTPNAQIWPRSQNKAMGGDENSIYCIIADMGAMSGDGLDFINGFGWLQRFYSVYDTTNSRVGIANTPNTKAETN